MGLPIHVRPARTGANRRDFFRRSGAAAVGVVATAELLPLQAATPSPVFQHGVASGDPLVDRVILWTRVTPGSPRAVVVVTWIVATDPTLRRIVLRGTAKTSPARDNTVKVDAIGLAPNTTCCYQFASEGATSPIGRTKTLPQGPTASLRMAVVSCSNHACGYFNVYGRLAERADLDLVMHPGRPDHAGRAAQRPLGAGAELGAARSIRTSSTYSSPSAATC